MQRDRWQIDSVLSQSWEVLKLNLAPFLLASLVPFVVTGVLLVLWWATTSLVHGVLCHFPGIDFTQVGWAPWLMGRYCSSWLVFLASQLVSLVFLALIWLVDTFLTLGLIRMGLKAVRGEQPEFFEVFSGLPFVVPGLLANLLLALLVGLGLIACVVPGVFLAVSLMFVQLLVADRGLGPLEALKESYRLSQGERVGLAVWLLVACILALGGMLVCCVGLLLALPLILLGTTTIYVQLQERRTPEPGAL